MFRPYHRLLELFNKSGIKYDLLNHQPVYTSEQAAKVRGEQLKNGAKALLLKGGDNFYLAVIPGDRKLSSNKLRKILKLKEISFASPEEVKEVMGCEIGACYPVGKIIDLPTFADKSILENERVAFNPGIHNKSIRMDLNSYLTVAQPEIVDIAKEDV